MKRKDLLRLVVERTDRPLVTVKNIVETLEEIIMESVLEHNEDVHIQFGRFYRKTTRAGRRHDPRTGEPIWCPARHSICFSFSRGCRTIAPGQEVDEHGHLLHAPDGMEDNE